MFDITSIINAISGDVNLIFHIFSRAFYAGFPPYFPLINNIAFPGAVFALLITFLKDFPLGEFS